MLILEIKLNHLEKGCLNMQLGGKYWFSLVMGDSEIRAPSGPKLPDKKGLSVLNC